MNKLSFSIGDVRFLACILLAGWGSGGVLAAQEVKAPTAPFVRNAPMNASWVIDYEKAESPNAKGAEAPQVLGAQLKTSVVTKFGPERREVDEYTDGSKVEKWFYRGYHVFEQEGLPDEVIVVNSASDSFLRMSYPDYSKNDFPTLDWLSAETYVGEKPVKGRSAYVFEKAAQAPSGPVIAQVKAATGSAPSPAPSNLPKLRVWIDVESRLPVLIENGDKRQVFAFRDSSQSTAAPPARFIKALQEYQDSRVVPKKN